ncbi:MAG: sugar phosphate isomerase/epimerase, partial [Planctomycetes bacterium]|nr:sugar phosphate isomerase/epimerase [Planctomycetota bacterium]
MLRALLVGSICLVTATALAGGGPSNDQPFAPKIGICSSLKNAELLQQSGGDYIEVGVRWFLVPDKPDADFAENLNAAQACTLPIRAANGFLPGSLKCVGPEADHDAVLAYAKTAFERAKQVGIETIVFGSSGVRGIPDGFDSDKAEQQFVELLKKMGPLAQAQGVVVAIEPLNAKE